MISSLRGRPLRSITRKISWFRRKPGYGPRSVPLVSADAGCFRQSHGGNGSRGAEEAGGGLVGKDRSGGSRTVLAGAGWFVPVGGEENLN